MNSKSSSECEDHWSNNTYCARAELLKTNITKRYLWNMLNIINAKQINVKRIYLILTWIVKAILWSNKCTTPTANTHLIYKSRVVHKLCTPNCGTKSRYDFDKQNVHTQSLGKKGNVSFTHLRIRVSKKKKKHILKINLLLSKFFVSTRNCR